jgi:hypothetical protein
MFIMPKHVVIICLMQIQCLKQLRKWLKISLAINNQLNNSWH